MGTSDLSAHIHHRGDRSVDGILRLIHMAGEDQPLEPQLTAMCREIADIAVADVVSAYVRETRPGGDILVMRGNIGFPAGAVGTVALRIGEGLTGLVGECMRPVSVAVAAEDERYKHVPGLGEERYPAFVGVPLVQGGRVAGVLVLQRRRAQAFSPAEVALATALGAPVLLAVDRARTRAQDETRSARLPGVPVAGGTATGRAAVVPTLAALPDSGAGLDFARARERLREDLDVARVRLSSCDDGGVLRTLDNFSLVLADPPLWARIGDGEGSAVARLRALAADESRVPYRVSARAGAIDAALSERSREIADLCVLIWASAAPRAILPSGGVWLAERLGAFVALTAAARGAAAVAVDGPATSPAATAILRTAGVPALAQVEGLFAWTRGGDLVVVDAEAGTLRVNPGSDDRPTTP